MTGNVRASLELLIAHIVDLKAELSRARGWDVPQQLGSPASIEAVKALERQVGYGLPVDYRTFLLMHDGWSGFNGQNDLLSTTQQLRPGPMREAIQNVKDMQREMADPAADGFVIEASVADTDLALFDPATRLPNGNMDVVKWDARMGEYKRYRSLTDYFEGQIASLERRIAKEKARLRQ